MASSSRSIDSRPLPSLRSQASPPPLSSATRPRVQHSGVGQQSQYRSTASTLPFLGANIVGLTCAADSFPLKTASNFVVICAGRGFIAFGLSYAVIPSVQSLGYDGTMNIEAGIAAGLSALNIGAYFCGPALRRLGERYFGLGASRGHPSTSGV